MREEIVLAIQVFIIIGAAVFGGIFLYPYLRIGLERLLLQFKECHGEDSWERSELLYRVPSSIVGFLALEYLILWLSIGLCADGFSGIGLEDFFSLWLGFLGGLESAIGIIGVFGVVCATAFGIYQDIPELRLKTLGVIALFGALIGLGLRFS